MTKSLQDFVFYNAQQKFPVKFSSHLRVVRALLDNIVIAQAEPKPQLSQIRLRLELVNASEAATTTTDTTQSSQSFLIVMG